MGVFFVLPTAHIFFPLFFSTFRYLRSFKCMVILLWENMDANQQCEMWQGWVTLSSSWYYVAVWKMCHIPLYITSHRRRNRVCQEPFFLQTLKRGADNFLLLFAIFSWVINDFFLKKNRKNKNWEAVNWFFVDVILHSITWVSFHVSLSPYLKAMLHWSCHTGSASWIMNFDMSWSSDSFWQPCSM